MSMLCKAKRGLDLQIGYCFGADTPVQKRFEKRRHRRLLRRMNQIAIQQQVKENQLDQYDQEQLAEQQRLQGEYMMDLYYDDLWRLSSART